MKMKNLFDYPLIIIGSGPAGYTASIYASRYKINHLVIGQVPGGLIAEAHKVCNFPTYQEITGLELVQKMRRQALDLGAEELVGRVIEIKKQKGNFLIELENKKSFLSKAVILAIGTKRRKLGLADEDKFLGKGISYCATCDAGFYRQKVAAVVGGANAAVTAALLLADLAEKVYLIYRRDQLRAEPAWVEQATNNSKIEIIYNTNVVKLIGQKKLRKIKLDNAYRRRKFLAVDGLFVEIGSEPDTKLIKNLKIKKDEKGYLITNPDQSTSIDGLFAAGDITTNSNQFRQVITACAEGAIAAASVHRLLKRNFRL